MAQAVVVIRGRQRRRLDLGLTRPGGRVEQQRDRRDDGDRDARQARNGCDHDHSSEAIARALLDPC